MDFIQLGDTFIRIDSILRVQMYNNSQCNYETGEITYIPSLHIYTKEISSGCWGETSGSDSQRHDYAINSPEGQAFLGWLQSHTKRLVPSDIIEKAKQA